MNIRRKEKDTVEKKQENQNRLSEEELVQRQLAEIRKVDPAVKDMGALLASVDPEQFRDYVYRGLSFVEAFWLCSREKLTKQLRGLAPAGKGHLTAVTPQGRGMSNVPAEELRLYRELLPELNDAEFRRHYHADRCRMED